MDYDKEIDIHKKRIIELKEEAKEFSYDKELKKLFRKLILENKRMIIWCIVMKEKKDSINFILKRTIPAILPKIINNQEMKCIGGSFHPQEGIKVFVGDMWKYIEEYFKEEKNSLYVEACLIKNINSVLIHEVLHRTIYDLFEKDDLYQQGINYLEYKGSFNYIYEEI